MSAGRSFAAASSACRIALFGATTSGCPRVRRSLRIFCKAAAGTPRMATRAVTGWSSTIFCSAATRAILPGGTVSRPGMTILPYQSRIAGPMVVLT